MSIEILLEYLHRKIKELENEVLEYKNEMNVCEPFGRKYWQLHDKYQAAFIKKTCLADVIKYIKGG